MDKHKQVIIDARNDLEHAIFHFEHISAEKENGVELRSGLRSAKAALQHLRSALVDRVYTSTTAERIPDRPDNLQIGVTAHCACVRSFCDDLVVGFVEMGSWGKCDPDGKV